MNDTGADMRSVMDFQCKTRITTLLLYSKYRLSHAYSHICPETGSYENSELAVSTIQITPYHHEIYDKLFYPAISTFAVQICYTNKFLLYS
jgi:hypothetical protein